MKVITSLLLSLLVCICSRNSTAQQPDIANQSAADLSKWKLVWQDDFDYPDDQLDTNWIAQNGPSGHILCSRWRENVVISNGILQLINRKEDRGGQEWTSGNIWTK
ncbi:putative secreted protein [Rhodopirellula sp. SWK7]|uniref:putative secreted protein n=1 Tax=Rhodopirellula sp. SWK7 TaxID=595460 RepID=UPI0002BDB233|nr:putative secreted protein [Rhodopirellula sp. SWK7]EMI43507.1 putative secreted protein [Rhodopirellula sp. SWK7]